jgi:large subunit ribosomal protein L24
MMKMDVKVGDDVEVICGDDRGRRGQIMRVLQDENRIVVSGVRFQKKCMKKSSANPDGAILELEMPVHRSNVRKISAK